MFSKVVEEVKRRKSDALGLYLYGLRREIGWCMPTSDIRFTTSVWVLKAWKWEVNSLNEFPIKL